MFERIPTINEVRKLQTVKVTTVKFIPKLTKEYLSIFDAEWHNEKLRHLKRVRKVRDFVEMIVDESEKVKNLSSFIEKHSLCIEEVNEVLVSHSKAYTTEQLLEWSKLWPMSFHDTIRPKKFTKDEMTKIESILDSLDTDDCVVVKDYEILCKAKHKDGLLNHATMKAIEACSGRTDYLLTGLSVFLGHEPCFMCAMALVHSRISRLFYKSSNSKDKPFSQHRLNEIKKLNHRFELYSIK